MRQPVVRLKAIKGSVWVLKDPVTQQYIAFADEHRPPHLAPLHLATMTPASEPELSEFKQLASRRLQGVPYCLERVDAL